MKNMAVQFYTHKQRILILLAVVLVSAAFLIGNFVQAADDNSDYPTCAALACDQNRTNCEGLGLTWTALGYPMGNPSCCGDDLAEDVASPLTNDIAWAADTNYMCWNQSFGCVKNSQFYGVGKHTNLNPGGNDNIAYCSRGWKDCDNTTDCDIDKIYGGESSAFGEYQTGLENEVCGDDAGEYVIGETLDDFCNPIFWDQPRCCNSATDKVDPSGNCVSSCSITTPLWWSGSMCHNPEDVNSPPVVGITFHPACSYGAASCKYKVYKSSTNNFSSASVIASINIRKVGGDYQTESGDIFSIVEDQAVTPNTRYYYWMTEYDNNDNLIVKSDSQAAYSGRTGKVTGLHSHFKYYSPSKAAILWQWDNYTGATGYNFTELESFQLEVIDGVPPHISEELAKIDEYGLTSVFDTSKPFYLAYSSVANPYVSKTRTLIVRPSFETEGTIACGPDAAKETNNYTTEFGPPTNLHHTSNTISSITWEWNESSGQVTGYHVYDSNGVFLATVTGTSFTWNNLAFPNKQYGIKVKAYNGATESAFTAISYAFTSIENASQFSCAAASKTSLTVNVTNTISDPQPDNPNNDYEKKINFSLNSTYIAWQTSTSKSFSSLTCGTNYTIGAKTRNGDNDVEEITSDTIVCSTSPCASGPDLIIQNIDAESSVCRGTIVNIGVTVKNIGDQTTGQTHKTKAYIDTNTAPNQIMDTWTDILLPNGTKTETATWDTASFTVGTHKIVAIADAPNDSRITEANENNNILEKSITVRECVNPGGDNPPTDFNLLLPANEATNVSIAPEFTWSASTDPDDDILTYHFYLAVCPANDCTSTDPLSADPDGPEISAATFLSAANLLSNTKYIWNVRVTDGEHVIASYNGPFVFTTAAGGVGGTPPVAGYEWCKVSSDTAQFLDTSTIGDSPIASWSWQFNDGTAVDTTQNPLHTFGTTPYQSPQFVWHSSMDDKQSILTPLVGSPGVVMSTTTFVPSPHGSAMLVDANGEGAYFPTSGGNFNKARGAIQFFLKPLYNSNTPSEPNHYFYRADGASGDSWELKFQNNGFYYKIWDQEGNQQCILSLTNMSPGWVANEWVKIVAMWDENEDKMRLYLYDANDVMRNSKIVSCTINFSTAITLGSMYVGNSANGGTDEADGQIDEFMVFNDDVYTLTGGTDNFGVVLTVKDQENDSDAESKTVVLADAPGCTYLTTNASAYNCSTVGLTWSHPTAWTPKSYDIYRSSSEGCATEPNNPALCVWTLLKTQDKSVGALYDDATVAQNTKYYYYLSANPIDQHNSTASCDGGLGTGTNICPLSTIVPVCQMELSSDLSSTHSCGSITLKWSNLSGAKAYLIAKSPAGITNFAQLLKVDESNMETYCPDGQSYCTYQDNEVVPVNVLTAADSQKYFYQLSAQGEDDNWSATSTPISDWSYCYRSKTWQER